MQPTGWSPTLLWLVLYVIQTLLRIAWVFLRPFKSEVLGRRYLTLIHVNGQGLKSGLRIRMLPGARHGYPHICLDEIALNACAIRVHHSQTKLRGGKPLFR
jgi:hypothetical protein